MARNKARGGSVGPNGVAFPESGTRVACSSGCGKFENNNKKVFPTAYCLNCVFVHPLHSFTFLSLLLPVKMHLVTAIPLLLGALASAAEPAPPKPASKGLHHLAREAGLLYFGAATDTPGQRERAGLEPAYAKYDEIMWGGKEFGQTTPTNGMKVFAFPPFPTFPHPHLYPYPFQKTPTHISPSGSSPNPPNPSSTSPKVITSPTTQKPTTKSSAATP